MKQRLRLLFLFSLTLLATFIIMKMAFMLYNADNRHLNASDYLNVIAHGFPQDLATVSYIATVPWLLCIISIWTAKHYINIIFFAYSCIIAPIMTIILISDCILYDFWQFKLDATIFNYMGRSANITGNISTVFLVVTLLLATVVCGLMLFTLYKVTMWHLAPCIKKVRTLSLFIVIGGLMFLAIRGGVGRSTMNTGYAYYSSNPFLNHSAVNPAFSLFYSIAKNHDLNKLYRFYSPTECKQVFKALKYSTQSISPQKMLKTDRPDIVLVFMEGLSAAFVEPLGGVPNITPNINLINEGVVFTQCYANSYRTDRGTVCTFSGYPSFPDFSVMKMSEEAGRLPSIARSLSGAGYTTAYLYGGDKNFTNANSYLLATGYGKVMGDEHFPRSVRKTHSWGVTDHIVLDTLYNRITHLHNTDKPFFITCQTLASHEDWQVPYHRIKNDPIANSMAYLDDCIGTLVRRLKKSPIWNNLLLVIIPDHGITYPEDITESNIQKYHIPLLWIGGAVKSHYTENRICNQTDLAATLLGQLGISHSQFTFSRDVFSRTYTYPCATHTFNRGVCFIDSTGATVEDLTSGTILTDSPKPSRQRIRNAHAILQSARIDLSNKKGAAK